jgi:protein-disulfide isomerase
MQLPNAPNPTLSVPLSARDHVVGPADGKMVLVEYGDYQCPSCRVAFDVVEELIAKLGGELTFGFRHFPLVRMHPDAHRAAQAAEAAAAQGKFWEMHARLFKRQEELGAEHLVKYAAELGLDIERFKNELSSGKYMQRVQEDIAGGMRSGVGGTPTFFVNGKKFIGVFKAEPLLAALQAREG